MYIISEPFYVYIAVAGFVKRCVFTRPLLGLPMHQQVTNTCSAAYTELSELVRLNHQYVTVDVTKMLMSAFSNSYFPDWTTVSVA